MSSSSSFPAKGPTTHESALDLQLANAPRILDTEAVAQAERDTDEALSVRAILGMLNAVHTTRLEVARLIKPLSQCSAHHRFDVILRLAADVARVYGVSRHAADFTQYLDVYVSKAHVLLLRVDGDAVCVIIWSLLVGVLMPIRTDLCDIYQNSFRAADGASRRAQMYTKWMDFMKRVCTPIIEQYQGPTNGYAGMKIGTLRKQHGDFKSNGTFLHCLMLQFADEAAVLSPDDEVDGYRNSDMFDTMQELWDAEVDRIAALRMASARAAAESVVEYRRVPDGVANKIALYTDDNFPQATTYPMSEAQRLAALKTMDRSLQVDDGSSSSSSQL